MKDLKDYVISIPDFPKAGIIYRDITGILDSAEGFHLAIDRLVECAKKYEADVIAGIEARGFLFGSAVAYTCGLGFVPLRKPGKLPRKTISQEYSLEYGTATIEVHADAIKPGQRVIVIDDLIATGGTAEAAIKLVNKMGGSVPCVLCLIELPALNGRSNLAPTPLETIISFDGE